MLSISFFFVGGGGGGGRGEGQWKNVRKFRDFRSSCFSAGIGEATGLSTSG